ncbi:MAG: D-glycerate dehydrogenase [Myxococcota bacterium]|nr:D-glycerate dehydrogenase [Myxococcota bacterium]
MSRFHVYVTRRIPDAGLQVLRSAPEIGTLDVNPHDRVLERHELYAGVKRADAVLCLLTDTIDEEVFRAAPSAMIFANYAVGYNNIDISAATAAGKMISNTPGTLTDTTADMAFALLMSVARRIPEADRYTRAGRFVGWGPMLMLGSEITGKTLGIVGGGRIGLATAQRAAGFRMPLLYCSRTPKPQMDAIGGRRCSLKELLTQSDFVSIHTDLNPTTHHLIGVDEFKIMKRSAFLINTARGPIVHEEALAWALQRGEIAGAGLDVFEEEPAVHPILMELENVVLCPHTGSGTLKTRSKMGVMAAENILAALRGCKPPNLVNPEVFRNPEDHS